MPVDLNKEELTKEQIQILLGLPLRESITRGWFPDGVILWTKQLISFNGKLPNGAPYAVTKPLPITYRQLKLLSEAIGFELQEGK